jgi:hypothetical protein
MGVFYALKALNMILSNTSQIILFWGEWDHINQYDPRMMANFKSASIAELLLPILFFFIALFIIFKSENIADYLLRKEDPLNSEHSDYLSISVLNFCIKIFGFFAILSSIPHVADLLSKYWVMSEKLNFYDDPSKIHIASSAISAVLYIIIGLVLVFYSSTIANKLIKIDSNHTDEADISET